MKKLLTRLALLMILCAALALPVFADAVTDSISVCIGYFGWSEDEYVEKAARSPARRTLSRAISLLGGRVSCVVIDSAAEKVLSGGGGICCGLDDPIFRLVSFLFFW